MWKGPRDTSVWHRCHDLKGSHCSWQGLEAACCFCNCSLLLQAKQTDFWCCRGLCLWLSTFSMQLSRKLCIPSHRIKTCLLSTVNYIISTEDHWDPEARFTFQTGMAISLKEIEPFPTPTLYQKPSVLERYISASPSKPSRVLLDGFLSRLPLSLVEQGGCG